MAENIENNGCSQRDNAEHEGYAKASRSFNRIWKERDSAQPRLLEAILYKDNFNRAYKRVKANKGAPGIDGMTIEEALPYLKEHQQELTDRIYCGKYTPSPVRRVEIPKPDGGVRKLGIPTVIDRTLQQAITQQLVPIYELLFAEGSYGYRPNRSAKDAILKVKEYAEQGYTFAVVLDLSKYFDTLNHEILINILRKNVKDERVVQLIKRYLKSGVMENGVVIDTEEGSPQGGNLSPLLANVYLNEFDQEFLKRGVPCIRYADDIVLLAKSKRASERLLESSTKYLEERLKLTVNREKSRTVSVFAIRNFKFLGFALGRNGKGIYVRVHPKSWKKFKSRLKELSSRKRLLWSSFFVTLVAKKIVLINLCCRPCFIWGSITIITVWTNMIIINVCKFFYLLIECFLCCKLIQICAFILQGIEVTLHRCIVVRISCFAHALCHIYRFAEFGKCFGRIL